MSGINWLRKIERLRRGDECEVWNGPDRIWEPATVIHNGMAWNWEVLYANGKRRNGIPIEHIRCRGQVGAWPDSDRIGRMDVSNMIIQHHHDMMICPSPTLRLCAALEGITPKAYAKRLGEDTWGGFMAQHLAEAYRP